MILILCLMAILIFSLEIMYYQTYLLTANPAAKVAELPKTEVSLTQSNGLRTSLPRSSVASKQPNGSLDMDPVP
jgi:hypothetical protein